MTAAKRHAQKHSALLLYVLAGWLSCLIPVHWQLMHADHSHICVAESVDSTGSNTPSNPHNSESPPKPYPPVHAKHCFLCHVMAGAWILPTGSPNCLLLSKHLSAKLIEEDLGHNQNSFTQASPRAPPFC